MMLGYDAVIVLPILLLLAALGGFLAIAITVYTEVSSRVCDVCGVEFLGNRDLREHKKDHNRAIGSRRFVGKKRFKKAA